MDIVNVLNSQYNTPFKTNLIPVGSQKNIGGRAPFQEFEASEPSK